MDDDFHPSARAVSELLHAEVGYLLRQADIPVLHLKGPTVVLWLYEDGERTWGDVDVLVPPSQVEAALETLRGAGFIERFVGVGAGSTRDHAVTMCRLEDGMPGFGPEVDLHRRFEGIGLDPEAAFEVMWRRRQPLTLAHVDVWAPDLITRALLVALNTARSQNDQSTEDLRRLLSSASNEDWSDVVALAARLDASSALRAGLGLEPSGEKVIEAHLAAVPISTEWKLRLQEAPRTALRLDELSRMTPGQRVRALAHWIVPSPAVVRMRDPRAAAGRLQLAHAYARRFGEGLRDLPSSIRARRHAARSSPGDMGKSNS